MSHTMSLGKAASARSSAERIIERPASVNLLLFTTVILMVIGLLMMTSASVEIANSQYGDPFFFLKRQALFALIGICAGFVVVNIPVSILRRFSAVFLLLAFVLLAIVLVPGIGKLVNGSQRWIDLGFFSMQPSELAKVFIVIYLAAYLEKHLIEVREKWSGFFKPLAVIFVAVVLLHLEPDHGSMVILMLTAFCMLFLAGAKLYRFILFLTICMGGVVWVAVMKPYVLIRLTSFLNPWAPENVYSGGYQQAQAQIAFGRGEWFGEGLGNSIQKLYFLPEAQNDFVFAIIGEELGLVGVAFVVLLFCLLIGKAFAIGMAAHRQGNLFAAFYSYGIALLFAGQALINIGANISLLPIKGLTLPFLSAGGSSLIICCVMVALLLRVQYETECQVAAKATRGVVR